jgi:PiT family inorganic phosphate transporter
VDLAIIIAVVVVALVFDYTNGFHDAANAIATSPPGSHSAWRRS